MYLISLMHLIKITVKNQDFCYHCLHRTCSRNDIFHYREMIPKAQYKHLSFHVISPEKRGKALKKLCRTPANYSYYKWKHAASAEVFHVHQRRLISSLQRIINEHAHYLKVLFWRCDAWISWLTGSAVQRKHAPSKSSWFTVVSRIDGKKQKGRMLWRKKNRSTQNM